MAAAIAPDLWSTVRGDSLRMRQILVNLLGNAVKFTDEGEVVLRARLLAFEQGWLRIQITISDTGPGIAPEQQERLFRPFAQTDTGLAAQHGGTGLGLVISRELALLMGGDIELDSAPGAGTTMTVTLTLPAVRLPGFEPGPLVRWRHRRLAGPPGQVLSALRSQIESLGADVEKADSPALLQHLASEWAPDVALVPWDFTSAVPPGLPSMTIGGPVGDANAASIQLPVRSSRLAELTLRAISGEPDPRQDARAAGIADPVAGPPAGAPIAGDVLVAEDVAINRDLICRQLEGVGFRPRPVKDGNEAVAAARLGGFALILMDMRMPGLDGLEATRQIRQLEPPGQRVPIVAITANASDADRRACLEAGMDDHLSKPIRSADLRAMLERWVQAGPGLAEPPLESSPAAPSRDVLEELVAVFGSAQAVSELINRWRLELETRLDALRAAVNQGDDAERERVAHALKGASGIFGAQALVDHCAALETVSEQGAARLLLHRVEAEADVVSAWLADWQARRAAPGG